MTTAGAHYRLGQIEERLGNKDAARTHYKTAVQLNPNSQARKALGGV